MSILTILVIELGAATALPSLLIAAHGHSVVATDLKKIVDLITHKCVSLNPSIAERV